MNDIIIYYTLYNKIGFAIFPMMLLLFLVLPRNLRLIHVFHGFFPHWEIQRVKILPPHSLNASYEFVQIESLGYISILTQSSR